MVHKKNNTSISNVGNVLKKIVTSSLDAASKTEDVVKEVKEALTDIAPPKEFISQIGNHLRTTKEEILSTISSAIEEHLKKINFAEELQTELQKLLANYDLEITGTIRFKKRDKTTDNAADKNSDKDENQR
ncbi:MAG: hypothetical protein HQK53_01655 [Oligoflexia bacterium]|nr:hypothetical protein [Oligoflexia bacterium]